MTTEAIRARFDLRRATRVFFCVCFARLADDASPETSPSYARAPLMWSVTRRRRLQRLFPNYDFRLSWSVRFNVVVQTIDAIALDSNLELTRVDMEVRRSTVGVYEDSLACQLLGQTYYVHPDKTIKITVDLVVTSEVIGAFPRPRRPSFRARDRFPSQARPRAAPRSRSRSWASTSSTRSRPSRRRRSCRASACSSRTSASRAGSASRRAAPRPSRRNQSFVRRVKSLARRALGTPQVGRRPPHRRAQVPPGHARQEPHAQEVLLHALPARARGQAPGRGLPRDPQDGAQERRRGPLPRPRTRADANASSP